MPGAKRIFLKRGQYLYLARQGIIHIRQRGGANPGHRRRPPDDHMFELGGARALGSYSIQEFSSLQLATKPPHCVTTARVAVRFAEQLVDAEQRAVAAEALWWQAGVGLSIADDGWRLAEAARSEWASAALALGWEPEVAQVAEAAGEATEAEVEPALMPRERKRRRQSAANEF